MVFLDCGGWQNEFLKWIGLANSSLWYSLKLKSLKTKLCANLHYFISATFHFWLFIFPKIVLIISRLRVLRVKTCRNQHVNNTTVGRWVKSNVKCHIWFNLSSKLRHYYSVQRLYIVQPTSHPHPHAHPHLHPWLMTQQPVENKFAFIVLHVSWSQSLSPLRPPL